MNSTIKSLIGDARQALRQGDLGYAEALTQEARRLAGKAPGDHWYKAYTSGSSRVPSVPKFKTAYVSDHAHGGYTKGYGVVSLASDGLHLYAADERVVSVTDAGLSPMLRQLVRLRTTSGKSFVVEKSELDRGRPYGD